MLSPDIDSTSSNQKVFSKGENQILGNTNKVQMQRVFELLIPKQPQQATLSPFHLDDSKDIILFLNPECCLVDHCFLSHQDCVL
jgi:hypothetical protein